MGTKGPLERKHPDIQNSIGPKRGQSWLPRIPHLLADVVKATGRMFDYVFCFFALPPVVVVVLGGSGGCPSLSRAALPHTPSCLHWGRDRASV